MTALQRKRIASPEPVSNETFKPVISKKSEQMIRNRNASNVNIAERLIEHGQKQKVKKEEQEKL